MPNLLHRLMKRTPLFPAWKRLGHYPDYLYWKMRGEPIRSPHLLKQRTVVEYGRRFGARTLIETGTYIGEMVAATRRSFQRIYTIELDAPLAAAARRRFARYPHIHVVQGDSQVAIPELLKNMDEPCIFWMDAGYYGWDNFMGNPNRLTAELEAILNHRVKGHVVLMDDARKMNGTHGAPPLALFIESVRQNHPDRQVEVQRDIIRITPKRS